ncbi:DUF4123 domain-containing protein [Acidocella facilis]|uniref:DUF4123 domain-containing protein n=1 Tax=Acidocella facilis TaxID=525 RepID=UPI00068B27A0|nr:DUF4123 domain-containing protein [Acidocella facilis]
MAAGLADILAEWPRPVFAVLDGAKYDDLPALLRQIDIEARALFLEYRGNAGIVRAGPHLALLNERRLRNLLRIEGIEDAAVFWRVEAPDEPALYRHLRTLNLVEIPAPPPAQGAAPDPFAPAQRTVMFRHWDPGVLAMILPVLTPAQRARLFGPAAALAVAAPEGALQAKRRADWPEPARGRLVLDDGQMQALSGAMTARSHRAIASCLRDAAPEHTRGMDEAGLLGFIARSEAQGRALGLNTERGLGRFSYLMLLTKGQFSGTAEVRAALAQGPGGPDEAIKSMMQAMAYIMSREGRSW